MNEREIGKVIKRALELLVAGDFQTLAHMTGGRRMRANEIETVINDYPFKPIMPPDSELSGLIDLIEVEGSTPAAYSAWVYLWTAEEGRSGLCLKLLIREGASGPEIIEMSDLEVP